MASCAHCPLPREDCIGRLHRRYCELLDPRSPDHNPSYRESVIAATRLVADVRTDAGDALAAFKQRAEAARERLELVRSCDYRGAALGCGCNAGRRCGLAKGNSPADPLLVTLAECLECVGSARPAKSTS